MASEASFVTQPDVHGPRTSIAKGPVTIREAEAMANYILRRTAKGTVDTRDVVMTMPGAGGLPDGKITLHHVSAPSPVPQSFRTTRAALTRIAGTEKEKLESLRRFDTPSDEKTSRRSFTRDSHRLDDAVLKAASLKDPSFRIYPLQRETPLSFGGGPPGEERPLKPTGLVTAGRMAKAAGTDELYRREMATALKMGDSTTHDPDSLHPRFLEYVHERTRSVPEKENKALAWAVTVMKELWRNQGIRAEARGIDSAEPDVLSSLMNPGSAGEYAEMGATNRKDPEVLELLSKSIKRYYKAGHAMATRGRRAPWADFTQQPVMSFGKKEAKAAKLVNGVRTPPVPRFIFNPSPVNYALAAFLHGDLSHQLQTRDPTHGPGFGPGRGKAWKFLDKVAAHLLPGKAELSCKAIMSDIAKWDANMSEALLSATFDLMESVVDKSSLDATGRATRRIMADVAKRQLMVKLIEHPSGYLLELFGCMPSGSFYTSCVNTIGNDLLALSLLGVTLMEQGVELSDVSPISVAQQASSDLVSYGDNQLIFDSLFSRFGVSYSLERHEAHLAAFGMKLKVDETGVSSQLGDVRFCSRGALLTPHGLAIVRSHTSIFHKIGGRAEVDPVINKLYVRALMVDLLGTDPILYHGLQHLEASIDVPGDARLSEHRLHKMVEPFAKKLYGNSSPESVASFVSLLKSPSAPDRGVLLSLRLPADAPGALKRFGTGLTLGSGKATTGLDDVGRWLLDLSPADYWKYVNDTGQTSIIYNN
ncbi:putative RNA-dependent RNA polymerase [Cladosporium cladosporioides virus 1]|uniref:Putative RNA-dependent RNA polymerase n=1 Tax=Cladosporium cladosporioides virus 1 TaxID=1529605 RepID=A0A076JYE6_9VIRU|nr:putative RNA-dependent RNA polymerase [Cladosporium cladosporioides virus 1]AII80567.1 putative RNA-dependent RNA polymerase [Cladosporium cladosporioides virus 1]